MREEGLGLSQTLGRIANLDAEIKEDRWAIEAAALADRTDFSEELVRLKSHLVEFGAVLKKGGGISKKLTFLLQEIHRETNTVTSKSSDLELTRGALALKGETEKVREQAQNIE